MWPNNDPSGQDPFQHMNNLMNQMLSGPFIGGPAFGQGFMGAPNPYGNTQQQFSHSDQNVSAPVSNGEPIVEEPDDTDEPAAQRPRRSDPHPAPQPPPAAQPNMALSAMAPFPNLFGMMNSMMGGMMGGMMGPMVQDMVSNPNAQVYSYSSSTVMSSGPNGTYHSSSTSRQGPGGVRETQKTIRDGRTGHESMTIARGLGEKERVITRSRDATGQMFQEQQLRGLDAATAHRFDEEWRQAAEQQLPMGHTERRSQQYLRGSSSQQQQQQQRLALPGVEGGAGTVGGQYQHQGETGGEYGGVQQQQGGFGGQQGYGGGTYQQQQGQFGGGFQGHGVTRRRHGNGYGGGSDGNGPYYV